MSFKRKNLYSLNLYFLIFLLMSLNCIMKMSYDEGDPNVDKKTIKNIKDQDKLAYIATHAFNCAVREEAVKYISDPEILFSIAKKDPCYKASLKATEKLREIKGIKKHKLSTNHVFISTMAFIITLVIILPISLSIMFSDLPGGVKLLLQCFWIVPSFIFHPIMSIATIVVGFVVSSGKPIGQAIFCVIIMGGMVLLRLFSYMATIGL